MPTLTVRQLDDEIYQGLKTQAESSGRSMEENARDILASAVRDRAWWSKWVQATQALRGDDLSIPSRSSPRVTDSD